MFKAVLETLKDRMVLSSSILGGALVVAAIILALGMASLGASIEEAGWLAHTSSTLHVQVSGEGPVEIRGTK